MDVSMNVRNGQGKSLLKKSVFYRFALSLLLALTVLLSSMPLIQTPSAEASGWVGWGGISSIYYDLTQDDPINKPLETAAGELETYLEQMAGRSFSIVHTDPGGAAIRLEVAPGSAEFSGHGDETFHIIADGTGIVIRGKTALAVKLAEMYSRLVADERDQLFTRIQILHKFLFHDRRPFPEPL